MTGSATDRRTPPNAVIFDLDGTLIDTPGIITESFVDVLTALGVAADEPAIRATIGTPLDISLAGLIGVQVTDPVVRRAIAHYREVFRPRVLANAADLAFPDAAGVLDTLRARGVRLGIATSKLRAGAEEALTVSGLRDYFAVVATSDQVRNPKPHPEMAHLAATALGAAPATAVVIGDSTADMAMATAAGMRAIGVAHGVGSPAELRAAGAETVADDLPGVLTALAA